MFPFVRPASDRYLAWGERLMLSAEEKQLLLDLARRAVFEIFHVEQKAPLDGLASFQEPGASFVSIYLEGQLRGCIGSFSWSAPLIDSIRRMAKMAAIKDPRFVPIEVTELERLQFEISVLSPPEVVENIQDIRVGIDGLILSDGTRRGVLLPQVASKHGWDREEFLEHTCRKASMHPDAWRDSKVKIERFQAEVFSDLS